MINTYVDIVLSFEHAISLIMIFGKFKTFILIWSKIDFWLVWSKYLPIFKHDTKLVHITWSSYWLVSVQALYCFKSFQPCKIFATNVDVSVDTSHKLIYQTNIGH
jgi:hypothetical protein